MRDRCNACRAIDFCPLYYSYLYGVSSSVSECRIVSQKGKRHVHLVLESSAVYLSSLPVLFVLCVCCCQKYMITVSQKAVAIGSHRCCEVGFSVGTASLSIRSSPFAAPR